MTSKNTKNKKHGLDLHSGVCELTSTRRMKINSISIERSKVTKKNITFSKPNLHTRVFETTNMGNIKLTITNRTLRTIERYGSLEGFLLNFKRNNLSTQARDLRVKLRKILKLPA